ncbi:MAG: long-chain fatty acid--CoA ligase [Hyphomicrobiaceae bacterium]|nr:long-chain fatty acid--CoA ligase [Hyphomicrobiaceae bacterium]
MTVTIVRPDEAGSATEQTLSIPFAAEGYRPWVANYPDGIKWNVPIRITPIHERVLAACDRVPDAPAMDFLGAVTDYKTLKRQILAFAGALQNEYDVTHGTRVALLLPNTPFYPVAYYALLLLGAVVVNCNPLYSLDELSHIAGNAGADIMVTLDLAQVFEKAEALVARGHIQKVIVCSFPSALPVVKRTLFTIAKRRDLADIGASPIKDRIRWFDKLIDLGIMPAPAEIDPINDIAVQQYTGGTTGLPKGAMLTHANVAANVDQIDKWGCGVFYAPSKVVAILPFFHIFAMTVCMNVPLSNGIETIMLPRFDIKAFHELMQRKRPNILPSVPTLLHAIANSRHTRPEMIASLELAISGGAPLPGETRIDFAKVSPALLAEGYGLTECSPVVCCAALRVPSKPMSIGMPLPGTDIQFRDLDDPSKEVPPGQRGELVVKGAQVMAGYFNNPAATDDAMSNGFFRTGDVGYVDEDGYVFLVDRIKDLILCSGFNVYPRNIEEALLRHDAVDEVNVIGVKDEYRGEAPVAFIKLKPGMTATAAEMKSFLSELISKIEMPRDFIFKDELPKTLIGKLSKKELREEYAQMIASRQSDDQNAQ